MALLMLPDALHESRFKSCFEMIEGGVVVSSFPNEGEKSFRLSKKDKLIADLKHLEWYPEEHFHCPMNFSISGIK